MILIRALEELTQQGIPVSTTTTDPFRSAPAPASTRPGRTNVNELIFDEFEDVSDLRSARKQNPDTVSKGSLNELLETNPVPTVFITNAPEDIDVAHLRRFDLVIEAQAPSRERRRELLRGGFDRRSFVRCVIGCALHDGDVPRRGVAGTRPASTP